MPKDRQASSGQLAPDTPHSSPRRSRSSSSTPRKADQLLRAAAMQERVQAGLRELQTIIATADLPRAELDALWAARNALAGYSDRLRRLVRAPDRESTVMLAAHGLQCATRWVGDDGQREHCSLVAGHPGVCDFQPAGAR